MLTSSIKFKSFKIKKKSKKIENDLSFLLRQKNDVISSLSKNYKYSFQKKKLRKYKKFLNIKFLEWDLL